LAGPNLRSSEFVGEVMLLGFWASWCSDCQAELEQLQSLHATYGGAGLVVLGISLDGSAAEGRDFAHSAGVAFPVLRDTTRRVSRRFALVELPTLVLVDRTGEVRQVYGRVTRRQHQALVTEIRHLLDE
jgi:peroxiredoxin